jgi:hypothetical protein
LTVTRWFIGIALLDSNDGAFREGPPKMPIGHGHPQGILRQAIEILQLTQTLAHATRRSPHSDKLAPRLVPIAGYTNAMIDRAIAERNYPPFQGVGRPLSVLTEFNVPHCARFKRLGRPVTADRQILTANI